MPSPPSPCADVKMVEASFTNMESGVDPDGLKKALQKSIDDLSALIRLTQSNLSKSDRTRIMCMITLDAHGRDIIQKMILEVRGLQRRARAAPTAHILHTSAPCLSPQGVTAKKAFQWQSQLKQRYEGGEAKLAIADARFAYQFEYLGNGPRLVITPLTDRIYVTATQALNLKMGCAPAGPAGASGAVGDGAASLRLRDSCCCLLCRDGQDGDDQGSCQRHGHHVLRLQLQPRECVEPPPPVLKSGINHYSPRLSSPPAVDYMSLGNIFSELLTRPAPLLTRTPLLCRGPVCVRVLGLLRRV